MRAYFWGNMYLSSIQQGIQALHCLSEMYLSTGATLHADEMTDWAEDYKTVVVLNGGDSSALQQIASNFGTIANDYPHAYFEEGKPDLNGAMTCVGIILPAKIYVLADELRKTPFSKRERFLKSRNLSQFEQYVITLITESGLAR